MKMVKDIVINPDNLFDDIGTPPPLVNAKDGEKASQDVQSHAIVKAEKVKDALDEQQLAIDEAKALIDQRTAVIRQNQERFDLHDVLTGWFTETETKNAKTLVTQRTETRLSVDNAASYGVVPDSVVDQFINSAVTKATGEARMEVARVLDTATGITRKIAEDKGVSAEEVAKKAKKLLEVWHNAQVLDALFRQLFNKTLNRVVGYQDRLASTSQELAKKQVVLESISSSLVARRELVKQCLYDTCVSGMALTYILEREKESLSELEKHKGESTEISPQSYAEKIQEQESLIEITTKRLIDLKAFAIKLIGLYSVLGNTRTNVAIIKADVIFTRTNLMATLGLQLGLVADTISILRISRASRDIREAEAQVSESVGISNAALNEAGNQALVDIDSTIRSLHATISAALSGMKNTHDNMQRVQEISAKADKEFGAMFASMAV
jgi:hypothetical protein